MADKHPYISGAGPVIQAVKHLRNSFPATLDAQTLKKLGFAPKNESYLINVLRFIDVIDDAGAKTAAATKTFSQHADDAFQKSFGDMVKKAYSDLFGTHGDSAWDLDIDGLITFFRASDHTSAVVGKRQANSFVALSALAGHREMPTTKGGSSKPSTTKKAAAKKKATKAQPAATPVTSSMTEGGGAGPRSGKDVGLTVRVEINLPSDGDKETYDRIFRSIKENLLNAE